MLLDLTIKDMDRQELSDWLSSEGFDPGSYSLRGGAQDECLVLNRFDGGWEVFYFERGLRSGQKWFKTETEACEYMKERLVRDPTTRIEWRRNRNRPNRVRDSSA